MNPLLKFALTVACTMVASLTSAQDFPAKPIRLVVPAVPGGATDVFGRLVGQGLAEQLGVAVIVLNQGGAGGAIGAEMVARSEPDGHTLMFTSVDALSLLPNLRRDLPYDAASGFTPIAKVGAIDIMFAVSLTALMEPPNDRDIGASFRRDPSVSGSASVSGRAR